MICPKCGKTINDTARFCSGCGTKVEGLATADTADKTVAMPSSVNEDKTVAMPSTEAVTAPTQPSPTKPQPVTVYVNENIGEQAVQPQKKKSVFSLVILFIVVLFAAGGAMSFTVYDAINNPQRFLTVDSIKLLSGEGDNEAVTEEETTSDNKDKSEDYKRDKASEEERITED